MTDGNTLEWLTASGAVVDSKCVNADSGTMPPLLEAT